MSSEVDAISALERIYSALSGVEFRAKYDGRPTLPSTGNQRDVLLVNDDHMTETLHFIFKTLQETQVLITTGGTKPLIDVVWKGITTDGEAYKLWVELLQDQPQLHSCCCFRVKECKVFKRPWGPYASGVSIVVEQVKDSF